MADQPTGNVQSSPVDLHTHSNFSDGVHSPTELIAEAVQRGVQILALTDHDTLAGLPEAAAAAGESGIELIPGVELSCEVESHEIHLLGYFVDPADSTLAGVLAELAEKRETRAQRIVERLNTLGIEITYERVLEIAGAGTVGRPHIARAMIEHGDVANITEAFDRYLANGRPGFVPKERIIPEDAVRLLRSANAIPVLAHPLSTGDIEETLHRLVPAGLQGIEVYYGEYSTDVHGRLEEFARQWNLVPTGGSDYHGPGFKEGRELGCAPVPQRSVDELHRLREAS